MDTPERISRAAIVGLIVCLPFELRFFPLFSNLQWLFIGSLVVGAPILIRNRKKLFRDRLVILAAVFASTQWLAAAFAGELWANSMKGALRTTAGVSLLWIAMCHRTSRNTLLRLWSFAAIAAAAYGLLEYAGAGMPDLFRDREFYFGVTPRLSGSFEYPTTAAAFYAISLPILWLIPNAAVLRIAGSVLLWVALLLTYSRGALIAASAVLLGFCAVQNRRAVFKMAVAGAVSYLVLVAFHPVLVERFENAESGPPIAAEYSLRYNAVDRNPSVRAVLDVTVRNKGVNTWPAEGENAVAISYHWYDTVRRRMAYVRPVSTALPRDLAPDESITVKAEFQTPNDPGVYLLVWDLKQAGRGWFTANGVTPGIVEAHIDRDTESSDYNTDVSRWYGASREQGAIDPQVSRTVLWKTAATLAAQSPLIGIGPDNFRLLYGKSLGFDHWDTKIRSNNLYLEILCGSGLLGLSAFLAVIGAIRWSIGAASAGVIVFLIHGLVDEFLMTTPIYFAFWMLVGLAHEDRV